MAVRFVTGRAGTGKTMHCLTAVREALRASPLEGCRLILLVPEQISLEMERSLLADLTAAAAHRAEVLSFRRLAYRVFSTCGSGGRQAISDTARTMLLRLLLARHQSQLRYYRRAERFSGFVDRLARTITEFISECVGPEDLPDDAADSPDDPARGLKLHDLRLMYGAYLDALGTTRLDPSQHLDVARERLGQCEWVNGAWVWVDGFAGFSGQERRLLGELARHAAHVDITVLEEGTEGRRDGGTKGERDRDPESPSLLWDLFSKPRRTMGQIAEVMSACGVVVEPELVLGGPARRFDGSPALARLERGLFGPPSREPTGSEGLRIVGLADRRTEVEFAVAQIAALVRRERSPLRYREIAVIVRDLEPYHALLSAALRARQIPFFIDRRRSVAHHPVVELVRGLLELVSEDYSVASVRMLLKTGLVGLDDALGDELENYLLATGRSGRDAWIGDDWPTVSPGDGDEPSAADIAAHSRINDGRRRFLQGVDPWFLAAKDGSPCSGATWSERIRATLRHLSVHERVGRWADEADEDGDLDLGEAHRQVLRDVDALLDDLASAMGEEPVSLAELRTMIESGLSKLTLGLAPPMLDQVLVGAIERSRQPDIQAAILLGVNDGAFPCAYAEDSILNDDDREWLGQRAVALGTPRRQRVLEEALLFYIAVTRARESLLVTYAETTDEGKELRPSPYLAAMQAACPGLTVERLSEPFSARVTWSLLTHRDLAAQLAYEFRHRPEPVDDDARVRGQWNDLYEAARTDEELAGPLGEAAAALVYENRAVLDATIAKTDPDRPYRASVSRLETFATCPFKHFAQYELGLKERSEAALRALDVGRIHHAILERFIVGLVERGQSLAEMDEPAMLDGLRESCRYVGETLSPTGPLSRARDRYLMERNEAPLGRVVRTQRQVAAAGAFRPKAAELRFGFDDGGMEGLKIRTPKGRKAILRGVIDRVDLAELADEVLGVVVDYKRTRDKRLDLSGVYHGLSLQLLGYVLVLSQHGATLSGRPIKPAGAFYVSLVDRYRAVKHPNEVSGEEAETNLSGSPHSPRGLLDISRLAALEEGVGATGRSSVFSAHRKQDGTLGYVDSTDAAEPEDFVRLVLCVRDKLGEWVDGILDGDIRVSPYRLGTLSPCSWCAFRSVCRFEADTGQARYLERLKRSEVFRRLRGEREGPSGE